MGIGQRRPVIRLPVQLRAELPVVHHGVRDAGVHVLMLHRAVGVGRRDGPSAGVLQRHILPMLIQHRSPVRLIGKLVFHFLRFPQVDSPGKRLLGIQVPEFITGSTAVIFMVVSFCAHHISKREKGGGSNQRFQRIVDALGRGRTAAGTATSLGEKPSHLIQSRLHRRLGAGHVGQVIVIGHGCADGDSGLLYLDMDAPDFMVDPVLNHCAPSSVQ